MSKKSKKSLEQIEKEVQEFSVKIEDFFKDFFDTMDKIIRDGKSTFMEDMTYLKMLKALCLINVNITNTLVLREVSLSSLVMGTLIQTGARMVKERESKENEPDNSTRH